MTQERSLAVLPCFQSPACCHTARLHWGFRKVAAPRLAPPDLQVRLSLPGRTLPAPKLPSWGSRRSRGRAVDNAAQAPPSGTMALNPTSSGHQRFLLISDEPRGSSLVPQTSVSLFAPPVPQAVLVSPASLLGQEPLQVNYATRKVLHLSLRALESPKAVNGST